MLCRQLAKWWSLSSLGVHLPQLMEILLCLKRTRGCARPQPGETGLVFRFTGKTSPFVLGGAPTWRSNSTASFRMPLSKIVFFLLFAMRRNKLLTGHLLVLYLKESSKEWPAGQFTHHGGPCLRWSITGLAANSTPYFFGMSNKAMGLVRSNKTSSSHGQSTRRKEWCSPMDIYALSKS